MLKIYRSNKAEWLARVLAEQLKVNPPGPFNSIDIVVNSWATSRWIGEQIAKVNGINANIRYPFPGSCLREVIRKIIGLNPEDEDPWRSNRIVWPILKLLPQLLQKDEGLLLKQWLESRGSTKGNLNIDEWHLARLIADAFDDYALYRPEILNAWINGGSNYKGINDSIRWQVELAKLLDKHIGVEPFGLLVQKSISMLKEEIDIKEKLPKELNIFGVSSLAPSQVNLIKALSGYIDIKIFITTPSPEPWKRFKSRHEEDNFFSKTQSHLYTSIDEPFLEATLGKMGSDFQQLLEGTGEFQLGKIIEEDLFANQLSIANKLNREPYLIEQIQQMLIESETTFRLHRDTKDSSLVFIACPGELRQIQLVRDQIIQWLSSDRSLQPRDILIMTPQISKYSSLISAVFNDSSATGIELPWCVSDNSLEDTPGLTQWLFNLLSVATEKLTANSLETLLSNSEYQNIQGFNPSDVNNINQILKDAGFRWGIDKRERGGDDCHSLRWCLDRLLLGLILPESSYFSPEGVSPLNKGINPSFIIKWIILLENLSNLIKRMRETKTSKEWIEELRVIINDVFVDSNKNSWEYHNLIEILEEWEKQSFDCDLQLNAAVVLSILKEKLGKRQSRSGYRNGIINICALEAMKALPYKVIILMGLDGDCFPRYKQRPKFNLLEEDYRIGDPSSTYQDRYVILEAIMSTRQHLLITWNCRDEKTGEEIPPSNPIQQIIGQLKNKLESREFEGLVRKPSANPLDRTNFISLDINPPSSCDKRNLLARKYIDESLSVDNIHLFDYTEWEYISELNNDNITMEKVSSWMINPQLFWLEQLKIHPREWLETLEDQEEVNLSNWQRSILVQDCIQELMYNFSDSQHILKKYLLPKSWEARYAGQGILPKGAASEIESRLLVEIWKSLTEKLEELENYHKHELDFENCNKSILSNVNKQIIIEPYSITHRIALQAWLIHLQSCLDIRFDKQTLILGLGSSGSRKGKFEIEFGWNPISNEKAKLRLQELKTLTAIGQEKCWPIPPKSGWEYMLNLNKGVIKSNQSFSNRWEGSNWSKGEKDQREMKICFGDKCSSLNILDRSDFNKCMEIFYGPIFDELVK